MTFVKFCGITNYEDAKLALDLGVNALGFNFYPASPRSVTVADAQAIVRKLPPRAWMCGVFVNHSKSEVEEIARTVGLDTLQFHGNEDLAFCSDWPQWRVFKAIRLGTNRSIQCNDILAFSKAVDYLVFDSFSAEQFGGTGKEICAELLEGIFGLEDVLKESIISGGLSPDNVAEKVRAFKPFGVDVASGIENSPGQKSIEKMSRFMDEVGK